MNKIDKIKAELVKELHFARHEKPGVKILFDHLPKCGGRSFKAFLLSNYLWRETFAIQGAAPRRYVETFKNMSLSRRSRYRLIQGHLANELIPFVDSRFVKITILRDPVDRIVSQYYFARGLPTHYLHDKIQRLNLTLEKYIESNISDEIENWYTQHFSGLSLLEVRENPDEALLLAKESLKLNYQHIGLLEDLGGFMKTICEETGLKFPKKEPHLNQSKKPGGESLVKPEVLERTSEINSLDVQLYGYAKNLVHGV